MFRLKDDFFWGNPHKKYNGYTQLEASEKAKSVYESLKDKIWPGFFKLEPWLDCDFVMDIVRPGGEEAFRDMVERGKLKTEAGYAGYEWRLTN